MVLLEAVAGAILGLVTLWLVLRPLVRPDDGPSVPVFEPVDVEETPKGIALAALKEIEFDRETGKLSDADYEFLKAKYTTAALDALRESEGTSLSRESMRCETCGPRPEPDARFCSACGRPLTRQVAA